MERKSIAQVSWIVVQSLQQGRYAPAKIPENQKTQNSLLSGGKQTGFHPQCRIYTTATVLFRTGISGGVDYSGFHSEYSMSLDGNRNSSNFFFQLFIVSHARFRPQQSWHATDPPFLHIYIFSPTYINPNLRTDEMSRYQPEYPPYSVGLFKFKRTSRLI